MKFKKFPQFLSLVLAVCLVFSLSTVAFAAEQPEPRDSLEADMMYLVNHIGQRLATSPNEDMAAEYIKNRFEEIGYTDVEWAKPTRTSNANAGRLIFADDEGDILGNTLPNSNEFGTVEGQLVDLGTYPELSVPEGVTGKIVGAVRFSGAPNIANLNAALEELASDDIEFTGALLANANTNSVASVSGTPIVPCVTTTNYFLNKALEKADLFTHIERHSSDVSNVVIATKPAPDGDPDLIIVVSSHMDSVLASPGASDNASGAAATIELARRFFDMDLGNIEVRFAVCGSEESGGMAGSVYVAESLVAEGKAAISINLNMDMICSDMPTRSGSPLNAVSMDISPSPLAFNLPAYLVTDDAKEIEWADGIDNVRIYRYGSSDHVSFANRGIDAASMIIATDSTDDIESINHTSQDNLEENYSYERHLMCTDLVGNAVLKAANQELSKQAKFYVSESSATVTLVNAEQLFKTYNVVSGTFVGSEGEIPFRFTPGNTIISLADPQDYTIANVSAVGVGTADNTNEQRNEQYKNFAVALDVQYVEEYNALVLSTDAYLVKQDDYANITTQFVEPVDSNTAIINYTFDTDLFQYADFHPETGVQVISKEATETGAKVVVMIPSYNTRNYGRLAIQAKAPLANDWAAVDADVEYVVKDAAGEKEIEYISASTKFTTWDNDLLEGDTNFDGVVDLIDLSNMIDWFGIDNSDSQWNTLYTFFDFNNNNTIDISDIAYVAKLIQ